jgi:prophage tail gpP-like protein
MIVIEINGNRYTAFKEIQINKSLDSLSGTFSFVAVAEADVGFPLKVGDSCVIYIDEFSVINGYIEKLTGSAEKDQQSVTVSGRDKTCDVIDSTLGDNIEFTAPISLVDITKRTLKIAGITGVDVSTDVKDLQDFTKDELSGIAGKTGDTLFDFLESYARMRQVLMTADNDGNILYTRAPKNASNIQILREYDDFNNRNNIISASWDIDNTKRFNKYVFHTQTSLVAFNLLGSDGAGDSQSTANDQITQVNSEATDKEIRAGRTYHVIAEQSLSEENMKKRATWEGTVRKARAFSYTPKCVGFFTPDGQDIWRINTLLRVIDDYASINCLLLVNSINFSATLDSGGNITTLGLVPAQSYTTSLEIDKATQQSQDLSSNYFAKLLEDQTNAN